MIGIELDFYFQEFQDLVKAEGSWEAPSGRRKSWRKKKESGKGYDYRKNPPGQGRTKKEKKPTPQIISTPTPQPQPSPMPETTGASPQETADGLSKQYRDAIHAKDWDGIKEIRKEYRQHMKANPGLELSNGRGMKNNLKLMDAKRRRHQKKQARLEAKEKPEPKPEEQTISDIEKENLLGDEKESGTGKDEADEGDTDSKNIEEKKMIQIEI